MTRSPFTHRAIPPHILERLLDDVANDNADAEPIRIGKLESAAARCCIAVAVFTVAVFGAQLLRWAL